MFLGQFVSDKKSEKVIAVKTFPQGKSVTSEDIFTAVTEDVKVPLIKYIQ